MEGTGIEIQRLIPYIEAIHQAYPKQLISVDTFHASVAEAALKAGAHIINDISCGAFDENILTVVAKFNAGYIGMHLTGGMESMHKVEPREDIMDSLISYFEAKRNHYQNMELKIGSLTLVLVLGKQWRKILR